MLGSFRDASCSGITLFPAHQAWQENHLASTMEGELFNKTDKARCLKNIRGLQFGKSHRAVENKDNWRKLVVRSSVLPQ